LSMHYIVTKINSQLELLDNNLSYVDVIETFPTLAQSFIVKAKRKRLRTLKDIAAYNVAKNTTSESDVSFDDTS
jgi:hypothetical protein